MNHIQWVVCCFVTHFHFGLGAPHPNNVWPWCPIGWPWCLWNWKTARPNGLALSKPYFQACLCEFLFLLLSEHFACTTLSTTALSFSFRQVSIGRQGRGPKGIRERNNSSLTVDMLTAVHCEETRGRPFIGMIRDLLGDDVLIDWFGVHGWVYGSLGW